MTFDVIDVRVFSGESDNQLLLVGQLGFASFVGQRDATFLIGRSDSGSFSSEEAGYAIGLLLLLTSGVSVSAASSTPFVGRRDYTRTMAGRLG